MLQIYFDYGSTQSDKQAAIDLVNGVIVGAIHGESGAGIYYVLVKGDGTIATIDSLAVMLKGLPQVWRATPHMLIGMGVG